jgi:hypothetical protein
MSYQEVKQQNKRGWNYDARRYYDIREFYKKQIAKFNRLGIGARTEHNVVITEDLINLTVKRYKEICSKTYRYSKAYENSTAKVTKQLKLKEVA